MNPMNPTRAEYDESVLPTTQSDVALYNNNPLQENQLEGPEKRPPAPLFGCLVLGSCDDRI